MKIHRKITIGIVIFSLILIFFQGAVSSESLQKSTFSSIMDHIIFSDIANEKHFDLNGMLPQWYPGFLLVQLVRGVIAFIVVLLILFDLIEPS